MISFFSLHSSVVRCKFPNKVKSDSENYCHQKSVKVIKIKASKMMNMNMNMINDPTLAGMIPFDTMQFYEPPKPRYIFKMPRVVPDQKNKFESDDLFKRLHRESEVRYTGFRDRPLEERQLRFQTGCREGHTEFCFVSSGTNLQLIFNPGFHPYSVVDRECDFDKEIGKVSETIS